MKEFNSGIARMMISAVPIADTSRIKENPLMYEGVSLFSRIVSPETLQDSYMANNLGPIIVELEQYGISPEEFTALIEKIPTDFGGSELTMVDMYKRKINAQLTKGIITQEDADNALEDFDRALIRSNSDLIVAYPFNNLNGSIKGPVKLEIVDEVQKSK
jgi:hypothetical protein